MSAMTSLTSSAIVTKVPSNANRLNLNLASPATKILTPVRARLWSRCYASAAVPQLLTALTEGGTGDEQIAPPLAEPAEEYDLGGCEQSKVPSMVTSPETVSIVASVMAMSTVSSPKGRCWAVKTSSPPPVRPFPP